MLASPPGLAFSWTLFSTPSLDLLDDRGVAFPLSLESLSVGLPGLRCELLERDATPIGLNFRALDRLLLAPGNGLANGED